MKEYWEILFCYYKLVIIEKCFAMRATERSQKNTLPRLKRATLHRDTSVRTPAASPGEPKHTPAPAAWVVVARGENVQSTALHVPLQECVANTKETHEREKVL